MVTLRCLLLLGPLLLFLFIFYFYHPPNPTSPSQHVQTPSDEPISADKPITNTGETVFIAGLTKPAGSNYSRILVMGKLKKDDISWVEQELPDLQTAIYVVDDESAQQIPKNKGHEAMVYLTYIIDHYDELPDTSLFFHPHKITWHNNVLLNLDTAFTIQSLSDARVAREGYFNARCHHDPGCPDWLHIDRPEEEWDLVKKTEERYFTKDLWQQLHPEAPFPASISQPCCAQFAVSKDRIRTRPRSEYIRYREWLLNTELKDEISGRIMEYTWQYIFAGVSEFCPATHACYCDGYGVCFGGAQELQDWLDILKRREITDAEITVLVDAVERAESESIKSLREQSEKLSNELSIWKEEAFRRGDNPKNRALEVGRRWSEGDGF
jgi:Protein of unknown function (DUF3431)